MSATTERCAPHGLATGPDGLCVLCRRAAASTASSTDAGRPPPRLALRAGALFLATLLCLGAAGLRRSLSPPEATPHLEPEHQQRGLALSEAPPPGPPLPPQPSPVPRGPLRVAVPPPPAASPTGNAQAARARQQEFALALRRVSVTLFSTSWCPSCRAARSYLTAANLLFSDRDVDTDSAAHDRYVALNPARTVPVAEIDGRVLVGFSVEAYTSALRDAALRRMPSR